MAVIDDFSKVTLVSGGKSRTKSTGHDKGHRAEVKAFYKVVKNGGEAPIPWEEIRATSLASILAVRSIREGVAFEVP